MFLFISPTGTSLRPSQSFKDKRSASAPVKTQVGLVVGSLVHVIVCAEMTAPPADAGNSGSNISD